MKYKSWPTGPTPSNLPYDRSRIIAAVVDEPYTYFFDDHEDPATPIDVMSVDDHDKPFAPEV